MILDSGESLRMRRAASIPVREGNPISNRIKLGCKSSALRTASAPSEASPMTFSSGFLPSIERMNRRKGSKSSTTRSRTLEAAWLLPLRGVAAIGLTVSAHDRYLPATYVHIPAATLFVVCTLGNIAQQAARQY